MDRVNKEIRRIAKSLGKIGFRIRKMDLNPAGAAAGYFRSYKKPTKELRSGAISLLIEVMPKEHTGEL